MAYNFFTIGGDIRTIRESKKYTIKYVAKKSNLSQKTIYEIENGISNYTLESFIRLCWALDIEISAIEQILTDIGKGIKHRRKNIGYTREKLAEKLDISISQIYRVESGKNISFKNFLKICEILESDPRDFLDNESNYI